MPSNILTGALVALLAAAPATTDSPLQPAADILCAKTKADAIKPLFDGNLFPSSAIDRISQLLATFHEQYGACKKVTPKGGPNLEYVYEKAIIPGRLHFNSAGKIAGIWFNAPILTDDSVAAVLKALQALPGTTAVSVMSEGKKSRLSHNAQLPLAVGSSFKLAVLHALQRQVQAGSVRMSDVIPLRSEWTSLPSGILQDWPRGSPTTLHTLASLMISHSDNTATDHLIHHLGRDEVEVGLRAKNRPFLTTLEMFKLKSSSVKPLATRYVNGDEQKRRTLLAELLRFSKTDIVSHSSPLFVDEIEWFFSTEELCQMILALKEQEILGINAGLADRGKWQRVAYKGGSEPGVINMTHALQHRDSGEWVCVSATWNHPTDHLSREKFDELVVRLLHLHSAD